MINTEILSTLIPQKEWEPFQEGREAEYVQPLIDLGYLKREEQQTKKNIQNALFLFRQEYQQLNWLQKGMNLPPHLALEMRTEPDSLEIKLLHLLIDMDGDFRIEQLPIDGEKSIISRVIYYRLGVLGLYTGTFDQAYSSLQIDEIFAPLRKWMILEKDHLKLIELAGNVPEMIRTAWQHGRLDERVLCFNYQPKKEVLTDELKKEVKSEKAMSDAEKVKEKQILDEIETDMKTMMPQKEASILGAADAKRIKKVITKKTKRRQSRAEKLRNEMGVIVDELKNKMAQQKLEQDAFKQKIQEKDLDRKKAQVKLGHLSLNIIELQAEQKQPKEWRKEKKELEKKQKKLKEGFEILPNDEQKLVILKETKTKLLERLSMDPNHSSTKKTLKRTEKQLEELEEKFAKANKIQTNETRLIELTQLLNDFTSVSEKINVLKEQKKKQKALIDLLKKEVADLKEARKKDQTAFDTDLSKSQKAIQQKHKVFKRLSDKLKNIPRRFRRELKEYLTTEAYGKITNEILNKKDSDFFKTLLDDPYNQFLIRLLQVHQWTNGYYNGVLDSDFGGRTFSSICEIDKDIDALKLRFVLYQLDADKGTWLLNVNYFFEEMIKSLDEFREGETFDKVVLNFEKEIQENPKIRKRKEEFKKHWEKAVKEIQEDLKKNVVRRIYFGIRSLARSIIRGIKRIIELVLDGAKKLIRLLRNFVHMLYREVREGLHKFAQGMAFLFGKRQITTHTPTGEVAIISRFDFDCDATVMVAPDSKKYFKQHLITSRERIDGLDFSLVLAAKVIKWVLKAATFGWAIVFMRIALYFKRLVKEFFLKEVKGAAVNVLLS